MSEIEMIIEVIKEIRSRAEDTIFSCHFIKKDGSLRKMVCRLGVKKGVKGVGMSYDPTEKGLLCVYDMQKLAFRMINLRTIIKMQIKGEVLYERELDTEKV